MIQKNDKMQELYMSGEEYSDSAKTRWIRRIMLFLCGLAFCIVLSVYRGFSFDASFKANMAAASDGFIFVSGVMVAIGGWSWLSAGELFGPMIYSTKRMRGLFSRRNGNTGDDYAAYKEEMAEKHHLKRINCLLEAGLALLVPAIVFTVCYLLAS